MVLRDLFVNGDFVIRMRVLFLFCIIKRKISLFRVFDFI